MKYVLYEVIIIKKIQNVNPLLFHWSLDTSRDLFDEYSSKHFNEYQRIFTARVAKVMFSQACVTHSVQLGGGEVTPDASWDRSHGHRGVDITSPLDMTTTSLPPARV